MLRLHFYRCVGDSSLQCAQAIGLVNIKGPNLCAPQRRQMCITTQGTPNILGQSTHIGTLAAVHSNAKRTRREAQPLECIDLYLARWALDLYPLAGILI